MNLSMKYVIACLLLAINVCMAEDITITITTNDSPVLVLTVPQTARVTKSAGKTEIKTKDMTLCVWTIASAKTIEEGMTRVPETIKGEVLKFTAASTNAIEVAGAAAKHLAGRGVEADDGDPATVDVVVFIAGKCVFAACVHGEGNEASLERQPMLAVLKTAKAP